MSVDLLKNICIFLYLIFFITNTAIADINVTNPNKIVNDNEDTTIDFGTININWSDFSEYKLKKIDTVPFEYTAKVSAVWHYMGVYLNIDTPIMPIYNSANYYINNNNTNISGTRDYKIFQLKDDYLGYIITAGHGENNEPDSNAVDIQIGENKIFPYKRFKGDKANTTLVTNSGTINFESGYTKSLGDKVFGKIFISIVVIPTANMQAGIVNINKTIGYLKIYEADWKSSAGHITTYNLRIKGKLNITLPSCNVNNTSIDLGSVPKRQIEAGSAPVKSSSLTINCPTPIIKIYAKAYDINYLQNRDEYGRLGIKCSSGNEAKGVSVEVKVDNKLPKFSEKDLSVIPKYNLTTGQALADNKLLDLGNISGTKNIDIEARYVKHANNTYHPSAQVTTGCANAGMGLIFNYR